VNSFEKSSSPSLLSSAAHSTCDIDQDYTIFHITGRDRLGKEFIVVVFFGSAFNGRQRIKFFNSTFHVRPASPKMQQQPSIGGWSVALAALLLLNVAFINANQGRIVILIFF
jgi:hypothetical protein